MKYTRNELVSILKESVANVKFLKVDGTERIMSCTLKQDIVPQEIEKDTLSEKKIRSVNEEVLPVWDTEKNGWRSFRVDAVLDILAD
tara:strand:+ start:243 stop:503 length:261 start_codon:yes stop_codon:yes gene_type:complete